MCFAAAGMIGGLMSAMGSVVSGAMAQQQANAQARIYQQQAATERATAAYNAERQNDKSIKLVNQQRTSYLSAGVSPGSGSALDIVRDTTRESRLDVEAIKWNGELRAQKYDMMASAESMKGQNAMIGGAIGALSPLIKGGGGANFSGTGGGGDGNNYGGTSLYNTHDYNIG